ncbi:MAG: hypothetical protein AB1671_20900 [Thermodesulfobacteriota bacterium]
MHDLLTWTTGHAETDALLRRAMARWGEFAARSELNVPEQWEALNPFRTAAELGIPVTWVATFYRLPHAEQVLLAFAWLHWWQRSAVEEEPGFAGWLHRGPGFALNHVSLLRVLTQGQRGVLGILHRLLEAVVEDAGDWDGDRVTGHAVVRRLAHLDGEYRYNVHDRELWPAVLRLVRGEGDGP